MDCCPQFIVKTYPYISPLIKKFCKLNPGVVENNYFFALLKSQSTRATIITTTITPTHMPALKIPPIASQLVRVMPSAIRVASTTLVFMYNDLVDKPVSLKK